MPTGKRADAPISSQITVLQMLKKYNGSTLMYLAHCTEQDWNDKSLYERLRRLERDGYVFHIVDPFLKRITHRYFLTTKAYETYFQDRPVFQPRALLPELRYLHDYRRNWSEKYTPSDYEHNGRMLSDLFPHTEVPGPVIGDALNLYDALGQGLGFLYEGKEEEAATLLDAATHSMVPRLIGRLHVAYWANHVLMQACIEAGRLLTPGPGKVMTPEEATVIRERFKVAFDRSLQAPDVDREALEVALRLSEVTHAQEAAEHRSKIDRRISDAEAERTEMARQEYQFRVAQSDHENTVMLRKMRARHEILARGEVPPFDSDFDEGPPLEEDEEEPIEQLEDLNEEQRQ